MVDQLILKIKQLPPLFLGFVVILLVMGGLYYNDPPKTLCDIQMQSISKQLANGFFSETSDGTYGRSANAAKKFCMSTNSPGGCHDMFKRLIYFEKQIRTLPAECGSAPAAAIIQSVLQKSLKLFVEIGWGSQPPRDKFNNTSWLDTSDLGIFCRMKTQYQRLYGKQAWKELTWSIIASLPEAQTLERRQQWERSLFSYQCKALY